MSTHNQREAGDDTYSTTSSEDHIAHIELPVINSLPIDRNVNAAGVTDIGSQLNDIKELLVDLSKVTKTHTDQIEKLNEVINHSALADCGNSGYSENESSITTDQKPPIITPPRQGSTPVHDLSYDEQSHANVELQTEIVDTTLNITTHTVDNKIRQLREVDPNLDEVSKIFFVKEYDPQLEAALIKFHGELKKKSKRSSEENEILMNTAFHKLPKSEDIVNFESFLSWLEMVIVHKVTFYTPDYIIKKAIIRAAEYLKQPMFTKYVRICVNENATSYSTPIRYIDLWKYVASEIKVGINDEILPAIKAVIKDTEDAKLTILSIKVTIDNYLAAKNKIELSNVTWVSIWRTLTKDCGDVYSQTVNAITDLDVKVKLEMISRSGETISDEILANNLEMNHELAWSKFSAALSTLVRVVEFKKPKKKLTSTRNGNEAKEKTITSHCNVCGGKHGYYTCVARKKYYKELKLVYKDKVYMIGEEKFPLKDGENLEQKYAATFKGRPKQA